MNTKKVNTNKISAAKSGILKMVKLNEIKEDANNPRSEFRDIDALKNSIEAVGLLHPIIVRRDLEKGVFVVVDGARRLRALLELDQIETQVAVIGAENAEEAQLAANVVRADLNILERARGYVALIEHFPTRYNFVSLSKSFGDPAGTVKRLVSIAKRIPSSLNEVISRKIEHIGIENLEVLAQVPQDSVQMRRIIDAFRPGDDMDHAISRVAFMLDFSGDAVKTGALVSAGKAFTIRMKNGYERAYTFDEQVFQEARKAYETERRARYGATEEDSRARTDAQRTKRAAELKKRRSDRASASKALPTALKRFLGRKPKRNAIEELGETICERNLNSESARRLAAALGVKKLKLCGSLRMACWRQALKPLCVTAESLVQLEAFTKKMGYLGEAEWVKELCK